jgi:hypothetical protein
MGCGRSTQLVGGLVVLADLVRELALKVGDGSEGVARSPRAQIRLNHDSTWLRHVGGRVVQGRYYDWQPGSRAPPGSYGGELVVDDMNLLASGLIGNQSVRKATNSALVCSATAWPNLARFDAERGVQVENFPGASGVYDQSYG